LACLKKRTVNGNFNSDGTNYGGSGVLNADKIVIEAMPYDGRDYSVALVLPPLGVVVLKLHKSRRLFLPNKTMVFITNENHCCIIDSTKFCYNVSLIKHTYITVYKVILYVWFFKKIKINTLKYDYEYRIRIKARYPTKCFLLNMM
jgi:hypothetical protein